MKKPLTAMRNFLWRLRPELEDGPGSGQCVSNWLAALLAGFGMCALVLHLQGLSPLDAWLALSGAGLQQGLLYQPLTSALVPQGLFLFAFCGGVAVVVGRMIEPAMGSRHWLIVLVTCSVLGSLTELAIDPAALVRGAAPPALAALTVATVLLPFLPVPVGTWHFRMRTLCLAGIATIVIAQIASKFGSHIAPLRQIPATLASGAAVCLVALCYLRAAGLTGPIWFERHWTMRRMEKRRQAALSSQEYMEEFVDPLLEKLHHQGPGALTKREWATLNEGRRRLMNPPEA